MPWRGFSDGPSGEAPPASPSDFGERFAADYQATAATELGAGSRNRMQNEVYQNTIDRVFAITGRRAENPVWAVGDEARSAAEDGLREAWGQAQQKDPSIGNFPDINRLSVERAQQYQRVAEARQRTSVGLGGLGGFAGASVAGMEHPAQMLTMPYGGFFSRGGSVAARVLKEAAENALIGGVTQVPVEIGAGDWRRQVGVESDAARNIAQAAVGGAIFGAGVAGASEALKFGMGAISRGRAGGIEDHPWWPAAEQAARDWGVDPAYVALTAAAESGGENIATNIKNVRGEAASTATGPFQFTARTWGALARKYPDLGLTPGNRTDPAAQGVAMAALTAENQNALRGALGRSPSRQELYAAHVFGSGAASKLAQATDSTLLVDSVGRDAIEANPQWNGWTVGRWRAAHNEKFGTAAFQAPEQRIPQFVTDAQRLAERSALDADHSHGGLPWAKAHRENMGAAEAAIPDGPERVIVREASPQRATRQAESGGESPAPVTPPEPISRASELPVAPDSPPIAPQPIVPPESLPTRVFAPTNRSVQVEYRVVDLNSIIPSHTDDFQANPAYRAELQPRERGAAPSREQVLRYAGSEWTPDRWAPTADGNAGPPLVGPDNMVESGNGRTLALRRALKDPKKLREYRALLESRGFDTSGVEVPALVAVRTTQMSPEERVQWARDLNRPAGLGLSPIELARADADAVKGALSLYGGGDVGLRRNERFARELLSRLPQTERGQFVTADGATLSTQGKTRIQRAMMQLAYGDVGKRVVERLIDAQDEALKTISVGLRESAGKWAQLRQAVADGVVQPQMDTTADLIAAVELRTHLAESGQTLPDYMANGSLFGDGVPAKTLFWMHGLYNDFAFQAPTRNAQRLAGWIQDYADEAMQYRVGDMDRDVGAEEVMRARVQAEQQGGLFASADRRAARKAEAASAAAEIPGAQDAVVAEARRQVGDLLTRPGAEDQVIDVGDGVEVKASELSDYLDKLQRDADAADVIASTCLLDIARAAE